MTKTPTLYRAVAVHLLECSQHNQQPQWLQESLDRLGAAFNAAGQAAAARVNRKAVGRKPSPMRAQIRQDLADGKSQGWIRDNRSVSEGLIAKVRAEMRTEQQQ